MKDVKIFFAFVGGMLLCAFLINNISCTREDAVVGQIDPPDYQYGTAEIKTSQGWNFDKAHSNVTWETPYRGSGALLTGRFNDFGATVNFDEDNPENTSITGWVRLASVNTGEPGRDAGCLLTTFGVVAGTPAPSDTAWITTKQIAFDNAGGYNATAELNFHGFKKEVPMKFKLSGPLTHIDGNNPYTLGGIYAQFEFSAVTDFGIVSANIADGVTVKINAQFKKPD